MHGFPIPSVMLLVPALAAVVCLFLNASQARWLALGATLVDLASDLPGVLPPVLGVVGGASLPVGLAFAGWFERPGSKRAASACASLIRPCSPAAATDAPAVSSMAREMSMPWNDARG